MNLYCISLGRKHFLHFSLLLMISCALESKRLCLAFLRSQILRKRHSSGVNSSFSNDFCNIWTEQKLFRMVFRFCIQQKQKETNLLRQCNNLACLKLPVQYHLPGMQFYTKYPFFVSQSPSKFFLTRVILVKIYSLEKIR